MDIVIHQGDSALIKKLLDHEERSASAQNLTLLHTLRTGVLYDRFDIVTLIAARRPQLWALAKAQPCFLLEASAFCEGISMFESLSGAGMDVDRVNGSGKGSVLAAACAASNVTLVQQLLQGKLDLNGTAAETWLDLSLHTDFKNFFRHSLGHHGYGLAPLYYAIWNQDDDLVETLLENGANPNQFCHMYPLQMAACVGHQIIVDLLIDGGASLGATHGQLYPVVSGGLSTTSLAVQIALQLGHLNLARLLDEKGPCLPMCEVVCDGDVSDYIFASALQRANIARLSGAISHFLRCRDSWILAINSPQLQDMKDVDYIKQPFLSAHLAFCIIQKGVHATSQLIGHDLLSFALVYDPIVLYALVYAGERDLVTEVLAKLIARSTQDQKIREYARKSLVLASICGDVSVVQSILDALASPFWTYASSLYEDEWKIYPLPNRPNGMYYLYGADDFGDRIHIDFSSAMKTALMSANPALLEVFLNWHKTCQDADDTLVQFSAAYIYAICIGRPLHERMMINHGMNLQHAMDRLGECYVLRQLRHGLQYALNENKPDYHLADRLLNLGADPHAPSSQASGTYHYWHTPLQIACMQDAISFTKTLLARNADVNALPAEVLGATAVQFAAINGNFEILRLLLEAGGDINAPSGKFEGRTAIEGAAENGRLDMVRHLLHLGADTKGRTSTNYRRTMYRAWEQGHHALAEMIQAWKKERYGPEDCEDIGVIMATITDSELGEDYY